jgi:isoamylase
MTLAGFRGANDIHIMLNMYWESLDFELPAVPGRTWLKAVDTIGPEDVLSLTNDV